MSPTFLATPRDVEAPYGTNIELECNAAGDPRPTISWYQGNNLVLPSDRRVILSNGNLDIFSVTYEDQGLYECIAENSGGIISAFVSVSVISTVGK